MNTTEQTTNTIENNNNEQSEGQMNDTTANMTAQEQESAEMTDQVHEQDLTGDDGQAIDGQGVTAAEQDKPEQTPAQTKEKAEAAHLAFVAAVEAHAQALGLSTKAQKGFFQVFNATTGNKIYVALQSRGVTRIDTTLPADALPGISLPLEKVNGRIECHVVPTAEAVSQALDVLASYEQKIRPPKKADKTAPAADSTTV